MIAKNIRSIFYLNRTEVSFSKKTNMIVTRNRSRYIFDNSFKYIFSHQLYKIVYYPPNKVGTISSSPRCFGTHRFAPISLHFSVPLSIFSSPLSLKHLLQNITLNYCYINCFLLHLLLKGLWTRKFLIRLSNLNIISFI